MKNSIKVTVSVAVVALFCMGQPGQTAQTVGGKITFYTHFTHFFESGHWDKWTKEFEEKFPGTEVKAIGITNYSKEMPTRISSGNYGDVLNILDSIPPNEYANFYEPLNAMGLNATHQFVERYIYDGNTYGFVYGVNAEAVVYNKEAFKKAGISEIPKTKSAFLEACDKLKAVNITPLEINIGAGWPMQQWDKAALMFANDGDYYEKMLTDEAPFSKDKPYGKAIGFVKELFDKGCTERDYTSNNWNPSKAMLGTGQAAMWFLANWSIPQAVEAGEAMGLENVSNDLGMFPLPIDDSGKEPILLNPDWALGVSVNSKNKVTAKAWIDFLLTQTDVANIAGFIPGDTRIKPTMPQLVELYSYDPVEIRAGTPSSEFKQAMSDARLDFMTGTYIRDVILAPDYDKAIADINRRWAEAIKH